MGNIYLKPETEFKIRNGFQNESISDVIDHVIETYFRVKAVMNQDTVWFDEVEKIMKTKIGGFKKNEKR